jgi:hypothetical protein
MAQKYAAIPTRYRGVQFRSRLEARYAAFFDLIGPTWDYEPIDLRGYIPDFTLRLFGDLMEADDADLVEIKPAHKPADLFEACRKIDRSGWAGSEAYVFGVNPSVAVTRRTAASDEVAEGQMRFAGCAYWKVGCAFLDFDWSSEWKEAGNLTQYRGPRAQR